jgi:hypothetical protein
MKALLQDENHIFIHFPGIGRYRKGSCWSEHTYTRFKKDVDYRN